MGKISKNSGPIANGTGKISGDRKKVALGLSGGVDSALAAALLIEQGFALTGVYLECWNEPGCRTDQDRKDALAVALQLSIPYQVIDLKKPYREKVVEYFYREYKAGRTPNPDTVCNREIKFGLFYDWAMERGFDLVATGHYARIEKVRAASSFSLRDADEPCKFSGGDRENDWVDSFFQTPPHVTGPDPLSSEENGNYEYVLMRGRDPRKDQSYFLYQVEPERLGKILFPIGAMTKEQVRLEARKRKLVTAEKPDSQGICFIGEVSIRRLLEERIEPRKGAVIDSRTGEKMGEHDGVWFYTIGQRGGWRVDPKWQREFEGELPAYYVVEKDIERNRLKVGSENELLANEFEVREVRWLVDMKDKEVKMRKVWVRIRNLGKLTRAELQPTKDGVKVRTKEWVQAVAEGQACVFYSDNSLDAVVVGGGVIAA